MPVTCTLLETYYILCIARASEYKINLNHNIGQNNHTIWSLKCWSTSGTSTDTFSALDNWDMAILQCPWLSLGHYSMSVAYIHSASAYQVCYHACKINIFVLWCSGDINGALYHCPVSLWDGMTHKGVICVCRNREILELGLDNEDSEHENDDDTNQSEWSGIRCDCNWTGLGFFFACSATISLSFMEAISILPSLKQATLPSLFDG